MSTATDDRERGGATGARRARPTAGQTGTARTAPPRAPRSTGRRGTARARATGRTTRTSAARHDATASAPRMPFVLLILGLLGGALASLLVLRTVLTEDAFAISRLQQENRELTNQEEALREENLHAESPETIAERAEELGMEPGEAPLFVSLDSGETWGDDSGGSGDLPGTGEQPDPEAEGDDG
ncbi:septum formation initiator family protein [Marinactinospora rubrisoli]|uniref:Septum formation initiator family protein n=1 Tax=Marinactinospora rubrisoli TaxID=2715399 RepID=A0ABW2KJS1_9ACTN